MQLPKRNIDYFLITSSLFLCTMLSRRVILSQSSEQPIQTPSFPEVVTLVKDGSYAIVIFLILIIWVTRKTASDFLNKHLELMESLKNSNEAHQETSEKLSQSIERITITNQRISENNSIVTKVLAKHFKIDLDHLDEKQD